MKLRVWKSSEGYITKLTRIKYRGFIVSYLMSRSNKKYYSLEKFLHKSGHAVLMIFCVLILPFRLAPCTTTNVKQSGRPMLIRVTFWPVTSARRHLRMNDIFHGIFLCTVSQSLLVNFVGSFLPGRTTLMITSVVCQMVQQSVWCARRTDFLSKII